MKMVNKTFKSTRILMAVVMLLVPAAYQSASAAIVGTDKLIQAENHRESREYLSGLMARDEVKNALISQGIDPEEAQLRLQSLTDEEVRLIAGKINELAAGQGVEIFALIIVAVIIATVLLFKFTSITDVFP
jgi:hypothetical protein